MKRREMFIKTAGFVGGFCFCNQAFDDGPERSDCCYTPPIEPESISVRKNSIIIDLNKAGTIKDPGFAAYLDNEELNVHLIILQSKDRKYHALSKYCTHGGQVVSFIRERGLVQCNNFNHSIFRVTGEVYKGPAPVPLTAYTIFRSGNFLVIKFPV